MPIRTLLIAAASLVALTGSTLSSLPAQAAGPDALAFTCTADIPLFGGNLPQYGGSCGDANGGLRAAVGWGDGALVASTGSFSATFDYVEPLDTCPALGTANGTATVGSVSENFSWLRIGAVAVITLNDGSGSTTDLGAALATFVIRSPVGNPCGQHVTAQVTGFAWGTE